MKRFVFPLDRVLRFRRLQMELVEAHLGELAFRASQQRQTAAERRAQALQSGEDLLVQRDLRGSDLRATWHWLARLQAERNRALEASAKLDERHSQVLGELVEARRKVKLLESLRQRKINAHNLNAARQLEAQAAEFYLAKRVREGKH